MKILPMLRTLNRNIVYLLLAIIVIGFMFITEPVMPITPHGLFLPATERNYPPKADESVKLYNGNVPAAKVIGQVRVELHFDQANEASQTEILRYARHLAAQAGADGLAVTTFFGTPQPGLEQRYIFLGKAIKTTN